MSAEGFFKSTDWLINRILSVGGDGVVRKTGIVLTSFLLVFLASVLLLGCISSNPTADDSQATSEGVSLTVNASNEFALKLYSELKNEEGNLFFSPYSISSAFAMVYEGAREETAQELRDVFGFPEDDVVRRSSFARVYNLLNTPSWGYSLYTANALWVQKDYPILPDYLTTIEKYYGGKATNLDFADPENSRRTINSWVESKTNNKIRELFEKGGLDASTKLVITNAIYFKGSWRNKFDSSLTKEEEFTTGDGKKINTLMMHLKKPVAFNYAEDQEAQLLQMNYSNTNLSMLVILPKIKDLKKIEEKISFEKLAVWKNSLYFADVEVILPKFAFEQTIPLKNNLIKLGVKKAFDEKLVDFSALTSNNNLVIDEAIHKTFLEVNEEGTEAAAVTAIKTKIITSSEVQRPYLFKADRPFLFLIQDNENGLILFMGRVNNPNE